MTKLICYCLLGCSDAAGIEELKDGILDRHYYEESYLATMGETASKMLGMWPSLYYLSHFISVPKELHNITSDRLCMY